MKTNNTTQDGFHLKLYQLWALQRKAYKLEIPPDNKVLNFNFGDAEATFQITYGELKQKAFEQFKIIKSKLEKENDSKEKTNNDNKEKNNSSKKTNSKKG